MSASSDVARVSLVTRDGLLVFEPIPGASAETFSAMAAAMFGAAQVLFEDPEAARSLHVTAATARGTLLIVGAGEEMLLLVLATAAADLRRLAALADQTAARIVGSQREVRR